MSGDGGGLYREPLLYDVVNTPGTAAEVDALTRCARRFARGGGGPGTTWLEPACGTGRYLRVLAGRGRVVRGYDPLPDMLAFARGRLDRRGADHTLTEATFTTPARDLTALGRADVAFCPVNSLRHLMTDDEVLAHFAQVAALLAPGGVYVVGLDLHVPGRDPDEDVWRAVRGELGVQQVIQYLPPDGDDRVEQVIVSMTVDRPGGATQHDHGYGLRTYTAGQWAALVARSALRMAATCDASGKPYAGEAPLPYQLEVLAAR
jgi:SAM-dependent methyltransferase